MKFNKKLLVALFLILFVISALGRAPSVSGFSYTSLYGSFACAYVTNGVHNPCSGTDGRPSATASISGHDSYGDTNSSSDTTTATSHTIQGGAADICASSSVCYDASGSWSGINAEGYGLMYDNYSITCANGCMSTDLQINWTLTGSFGGLDSGTTCNPLALPSACQSTVVIFINLISYSGGRFSGLCTGGLPSNGCPPTVVDYQQGWKGCQGGSVPSDYCPSSTSFSLSGSVDLDSILFAGYAQPVYDTSPAVIQVLLIYA
ncbi:MAG: hypothetical protein ACYC7D_13355 [Nitrososphaerales archaeon]